MKHNRTRVRLKQSSPIPFDIEFTCNNREIFVIAGPSGSGKTTILRSIAGLYKPASGVVTCQGRTWLDSAAGIDVPVQQRPVGLVFQNYALFPHMTVYENIAVAMPEKNKQVRKLELARLLERVHLKGLDDRLPHQLSGGQQQRVAVARALARHPDILLLDEPFSSVDQQTRRNLVRDLAQLRNHLDIPIIHVTHDLNEARRIADKLCVIDKGCSLQIDTPENVMTRPISSQVAMLTGHDNIYKGVLKQHDPENQKSIIDWHGRSLETIYNPDIEINEEIDWFIPSSQVILAGDRRSTEAQKNLLDGKVVEIIQLGEGSVLSIAIPGIPDLVHMNLTTHQIRHDGLDSGSKIMICMITEGIHLMRDSTPEIN